MEWIQTLTIIGVFAAFFIYLMSRMDVLRSELIQEMQAQNKELRLEMQQCFANLQQFMFLAKIDKKIGEDVVKE